MSEQNQTQGTEGAPTSAETTAPPQVAAVVGDQPAEQPPTHSVGTPPDPPGTPAETPPPVAPVVEPYTTPATPALKSDII